MSKEITLAFDSGQTVYFLIVESSTGRFYEGAGFENYATANFADYAIVAIEQGTASGIYQGDFPAVASGSYGVVAYAQAGDDPSETDPQIGVGSLEWDGISVAATADDTFGVTTLLARISATRAGYLDRLDATISSRSSHTAADVNAQCDQAIADARLNQLLAISLASAPASGSLFADLTENDAGVRRFTANALEQAPAGEGGGGEGFSVNERDAIKAILGVEDDDATPATPTAGVLALIRERTDLIRAGRVQVTAPVVREGAIDIVAGDDYFAADSRSLAWTDPGGAWPDLEDAVVELIAVIGVEGSKQSFQATGSLVNGNHVRFELTAEETSTLSAGWWDFAIRATFENGHVATLVLGKMLVREAPSL